MINLFLDWFIFTRFYIVIEDRYNKYNDIKTSGIITPQNSMVYTMVFLPKIKVRRTTIRKQMLNKLLTNHKNRLSL
jgi:hypothetical protein